MSTVNRYIWNLCCNIPILFLSIDLKIFCPDEQNVDKTRWIQNVSFLSFVKGKFLPIYDMHRIWRQNRIDDRTWIELNKNSSCVRIDLLAAWAFLCTTHDLHNASLILPFSLFSQSPSDRRQQPSLYRYRPLSQCLLAVKARPSHLGDEFQPHFCRVFFSVWHTLTDCCELESVQLPGASLLPCLTLKIEAAVW